MFALIFPAGAADEKTCDQNRDQLLSTLQTDRDKMLKKIERLIEQAGDAAEKEHLQSQLEQVWDREEEMRALAGQIWRDCMQYQQR